MKSLTRQQIAGMNAKGRGCGDSEFEARAQLPAQAQPERIYRPKTCQFIEGEPSFNDDCKCGAPVVEGSAYCRHHQERATRGAKAPTRGHIPMPDPRGHNSGFELEAA